MNFGSEKFAAIGAKFFTKYVKISHKYYSRPDLWANNQKTVKMSGSSLGGEELGPKGPGW